MAYNSWPDDILAMLKKCIDDKWSSGRAADHLTKQFSSRRFTRNMLIGVARRKGWHFHSANTSERVPHRSGPKPGSSRVPKFRPRPRNPLKRGFNVSMTPDGPILEPTPPHSHKDGLLSDNSIPVDQRKTFMELRASDCRWVIGEANGLETQYCGARVKPEKPYCPGHCARAYGRY